MDFIFSLPAIVLFLSLAPSYLPLSASWQIQFNWPLLARNTQQDVIQPTTKRGVEQAEY